MKRLLILCITVLIALAGCGGDDEGDSAGGGAETTATETTPAETETTETQEGGGEHLELTADKSQLKFDKDALEATAGSVTIEMENPSPLPHNVALKGGGVDEKGDVVNEGETSTVTADLKAGSYTFYCSVPGHEAGGMKGTLTVK